MHSLTLALCPVLGHTNTCNYYDSIIPFLEFVFICLLHSSSPAIFQPCNSSSIGSLLGGVYLSLAKSALGRVCNTHGSSESFWI